MGDRDAAPDEPVVSDPVEHEVREVGAADVGERVQHEVLRDPVVARQPFVREARRSHQGPVEPGLADQVLAEGIKVTDLNPGPVDTDYWGDRPVPREKFLRADDVAEAILYVLAQPEHVLIREINFDNIAYFKK